VWFCPELWDRSWADTLDYIVNAATLAEAPRARLHGRLVFSVGSELTLFMQDIVQGGNVLERLGHSSFWETVRAGKHNVLLNVFLAKATASVRQVFHGPVVYASVPLETVDWSLFDLVCMDLCRDKRIKDRYSDPLTRHFAFNKPVVNTEFDCCTFKGANEIGGMGRDIIDFSKTPPQLKGDYVYDQGTQARELTDLLCILDHAKVDGTFVFTFVQPLAGFTSKEEKQKLKEVKFDLDIASYSLVKSCDEGKRGSTYPDMPWEPKESFKAVADYYAK
jgi:hypothetical protein